MIRELGSLAMACSLTMALARGASAQVVSLPARDVALAAPVAAVYRVGKADGATWEIYGSRVDVGFDGSGNLYVFDPQNFRVVVIGPTGAFLRTVGARGEGPGELRNPVGFAVFRDGTIAVADFGQRAFLLYDRAGAYQRSVRFGSETYAALGALQADPRGDP
jgi:hypothetical protein